MCGVPLLTAQAGFPPRCPMGRAVPGPECSITAHERGISMVSNCANPGCGKPLHYLREGRIYIFDASVRTTEPGAKRVRCLEHYWLCGACAEALILVQDPQGIIHVLSRPAAILEADEQPRVKSAMLAS